MILLSRCMTEDGEIWGPQRLFKGYEAVSEKIEGFHARMRGARLVLASGLNTFLNIARFKVAIVNEDGSTRSEGDSFIEMAEGGRIVVSTQSISVLGTGTANRRLVATSSCIVTPPRNGRPVCGLTRCSTGRADTRLQLGARRRGPSVSLIR